MATRFTSIAAVSIVVGLLPIFAHAFPFGGRASIVLRCPYNSTIYANLGAPRGGEYIWTTNTRTYLFGPPAYAGQWLLGLAGAPYYCIYRISPLDIYTGIAITMMGSSGAPAPAGPQLPIITPGGGGGGGGSGGGAGGGGGGAGGGGGTTSHILITEVYYNVDSAHGLKPQNEWVELYNPTASAVDLSNWILQDGSFTGDRLPAGTTLAPGAFLVVSDATTTRAVWSIPQTVRVIGFGTPLGDGLSNTSDAVILKSPSGMVVDAVSWGGNTQAFNPSVTPALYGHSSARNPLTADTDSRADWMDRATSTPGR